MYGRYGKRLLDVVASLGLLIVLAPALALVACAIGITSRGGVFYRQERIGRGGEPFQIVKFRTMRRLEDSVDETGALVENNARVTAVGRVLREWGLDEIPQLFNVLVGEMSIVGPRPTLRYQVERYTAEQRGRLVARPGITGLAQVMGRNELTWDEKIELDLRYLEHVSLLGDARILLRTASVLLRRQGVAFERHDGLSEHETDYSADI